MPPRRRVDPVAGARALAAWAAAPGEASGEVVATAVRFTLEELAARHPGRAVEVRVPPYGATQCVAGTTHTRGTPPNVVETEAVSWLGLVTGIRDWADELSAGRIYASGERSDLSKLLPFFALPR